MYHYHLTRRFVEGVLFCQASMPTAVPSERSLVTVVSFQQRTGTTRVLSVTSWSEKGLLALNA